MITDTIYSFGGTYTTGVGCTGSNVVRNPINNSMACSGGYTDYTTGQLAANCTLHACYATTTDVQSITVAFDPTVASTTLPVDNPIGDLFTGFILAYVVTFGVIWFFRKRS